MTGLGVWWLTEDTYCVCRKAKRAYICFSYKPQIKRQRSALYKMQALSWNWTTSHIETNSVIVFPRLMIANDSPKHRRPVWTDYTESVYQGMHFRFLYVNSCEIRWIIQFFPIKLKHLLDAYSPISLWDSRKTSKFRNKRSVLYGNNVT